MTNHSPTPAEGLDKLFERMEYTVLNSQISMDEFRTQVWFNITNEHKAAIQAYVRSQQREMLQKVDEPADQGDDPLTMSLKAHLVWLKVRQELKRLEAEDNDNR